MKPRRIQRKRTKGWKMPPNTSYVGRGSKWGNPFFVDPEHTLDTHNPPKHMANIFACKTAAEAVRCFEETSIDRTRLFHLPLEVGNIQKALKGKNLACWCKIKEKGLAVPCHADVLLKIANKWKGG